MSTSPIVPFNDLPAIADTRILALKILGLMVTIDMAREAFRLARGARADFFGAAVRGAVAAIVVTGLQQVSLWIAEGTLAVSDYLFAAGSKDLMTRSFRAAMRNFNCGDLGILDWFSDTAILLGIAHGIMYFTMLAKLFVVDAMWPLMFSLTVYLGILTVPITFLRPLGGLGHYARRVVAVALWPIVFAFLTLLIGATFPKTFDEVARGAVSIQCQSLVAAFQEGEGVTSSASLSTPNEGSLWGILKFLALCLAFAYLTLKTPLIASMAVGEATPEGLAGQLTGLIPSKLPRKRRGH